MHITFILYVPLGNIYIKLKITVNSQLKNIVSAFYSLQDVSAEMVVFRKYINIKILGRLIITHRFKKKGDLIFTLKIISVHNFRINRIYET